MAYVARVMLGTTLSPQLCFLMLFLCFVLLFHIFGNLLPCLGPYVTSVTTPEAFTRDNMFYSLFCVTLLIRRLWLFNTVPLSGLCSVNCCFLCFRIRVWVCVKLAVWRRVAPWPALSQFLFWISINMLTAVVCSGKC